MALMLRHPGAEEVEEPVYVGSMGDARFPGFAVDDRTGAGIRAEAVSCAEPILSREDEHQRCVGAGCSEEQESLRQSAG